MRDKSLSRFSALQPKKVHIAVDRCRISWSVLFFLLMVQEVSSQHRISLQLGASVPMNIPMPLAIQQSGQPDIGMTAHYSSEPFVVPVCWVWRIGYWFGKSAWEFEAIHQKLYLDNVTPEVENFSVSHGWNLVTLNRVWDLDDIEFRFGFGVVLTHAESLIRGKKYDESGGIFGLGYFVSGPTVAIGVGRRVILTEQIFLYFDGRAAFSCAKVKVAEGSALVHNIAVLASVMVGYDLRMNR